MLDEGELGTDGVFAILSENVSTVEYKIDGLSVALYQDGIFIRVLHGDGRMEKT